MASLFYPYLHLLLAFFSGKQRAQLRFVREENRILRARLEQTRLILSPEERKRLMAIGAGMDHRVNRLISVATYATYQRWLREKRDQRPPRRVGRPRKVTVELRQLIVRLSAENRTWGCLRIVGELLKLRVRIGKSTVRRVLIDEGVAPSPRSDRSARPDFQPWDQFIKLHMSTLTDCDFLCQKVWTPLGRRDAYLLAFIHVGTRRAWVSPAAFHPNEDWVKQQARNWMMWLEDESLAATHLIHDRDCKFSRGFDGLLLSTGVRAVKTPFMAPNANAFAESFIAALRRECLNRFYCFGLGHVDHIVQMFVTFYNTHRPHQGLDNHVLEETTRSPLRPAQEESLVVGNIGYKAQLDGLLKHDYHKAA
ncbi:MAG: integrase core domain-containing protein [Planctomycetota bacterium]